ncbi:MAG: response regulator [Candidatus Caldarchaeum sp.]
MTAEQGLGRYSFLLIGTTAETRWPEVLKDALSPLGELHIASERETIRAVSEREYDVILVDAGAIQDLIQMIGRLRSQQPRARIVVVTASPTWQQSREVFRAGAADYIRKSLDKGKLRAQIEALLQPLCPPSSETEREQ